MLYSAGKVCVRPFKEPSPSMARPWSATEMMPAHKGHDKLVPPT